MAEASSSHRPEAKTFVEDSGSDRDDVRAQSSSTGSKRQSHYSTQRTGRSSRPVSGSSQLTSKSRGRRASYQQPADYQNLDDLSRQAPIGQDGPLSLEQARRLSPETGLKPKNLAQFDALQGHASGRSEEGQELSEEAAPPPIQQNLQHQQAAKNIAQQKPLLDDPEAGDADDESSGAPSPYVSRRPEDYLPNQRETPPAVPRWLTETYTISYLIFFSILGTLARLGMQWLTFYPGAPIVTPVIWANFAGCVFMGFMSEDQALFRDHCTGDAADGEKQGHLTEAEADNKAERAKRKKTIPLYIGLATGFCGSLTSFSSFARDGFLALSNDLPTPVNHPGDLAYGSPKTTSTVHRSGGYSFEAWAAVVIATLALSLGGLIVGAHTALLLHPVTPRVSIRLSRLFLDPLVVFLGWASWISAVFLAIWPPDRPGGPSSRGTWANETWRGQVLFALVFAPVGCLLRFYASLKLNGIVSAFPLGTFAVNMLGTAIEGMCYDVQHVGIGIIWRVGGGRVGCQVLQGVQDGFCGCLTTKSMGYGGGMGTLMPLRA
ncbi:hypothetical protein LTR53_012247 [Teratosphaeriaceae sp. CCFEE 6253]|nr:hypothetical protein LTR53_012247 [Teratosphaeriaceae sp. CCFEE 6253]